MINLLNNAIKFIHQGSINISGDSFDTDDQSRSLTIIVNDTGIGIKE